MVSKSLAVVVMTSEDSAVMRTMAVAAAVGMAVAVAVFIPVLVARAEA